MAQLLAVQLPDIASSNFISANADHVAPACPKCVDARDVRANVFNPPPLGGFKKHRRTTSKVMRGCSRASFCVAECRFCKCEIQNDVISGTANSCVRKGWHNKREVPTTKFLSFLLATTVWEEGSGSEAGIFWLAEKKAPKGQREQSPPPTPLPPPPATAGGDGPEPGMRRMESSPGNLRPNETCH